MKLYGSFLIRCWIHSGEEQNQKIVFDVEHIQGGEHLRFNDPDEAWQWMMRMLQSGFAESQQSAGSANAAAEKPTADDLS